MTASRRTFLVFSSLRVHAAQFESASLSEFNNRWSVIHDFDGGVGGENWSLLNEDNPVVITLPTEGEFAEVGIIFSHETSLVPYTLGVKQKPEGEVSYSHAPS